VSASAATTLRVTDRTEEVRLAMAWNGGVSLAIWMGGVAVELDCARRAHLGIEDHGVGADYGSEKEGAHPRTIYNALCRAFDRVVVIDILTGASAGGINGALLGAVITNTRRLHPSFLRERWIGLGDFSTMLRPTNSRKPESLMDGEYFRRQLVGTFRDCLGEQDADGRAAELGTIDGAGFLPTEVSLDIQSTNVYGTLRKFTDHWGELFVAREFRSPLRFRQGNDFMAPKLAMAARASASFPGAFEPAKIDGDGAILAGYPGKVRWGIDGGLLENAPIEAAIELIPARPATRPVRRWVCYVNADPPNATPTPEVAEQPNLQKVLGYVVNLPRDARFIDELVAIESATRRSEVASTSVRALADLDWDALGPTAVALLPTYRRSRAITSLEEVLVGPGQPPDPGGARVVFDRLESENLLELPWIPQDGPLETSIIPWRWGVRAAQRILYLELDLLRMANPDSLVESRGPIDSGITALEAVADDLRKTGSVREATRELAGARDLREKVVALDAVFDQFRDDINRALVGATLSFVDAMLPLDSSRGLFAGATDREGAVGEFLRRALAIEVVRRAFCSDQDVDSAQRFSFAQLTPLAPCPILTDKPLREPGPNSPEEKLTGIDLNHFAAFYRASWRANDFMWGRLDAATRIVDLLVDAGRAETVRTRAQGAIDPGLVLAEALVPLGDSQEAVDQRAIVKEALDDAKSGYEGRPDGVALKLGPPLPGGAPQLRERVRQVIDADLELGSDAKLTRVLCARAAQYEALRQELPVLAKQSEEDGKAGCFTKPFPHEPTAPMFDAIKALRTSIAGRLPLPRKLGRGVPDEATSMLALRTVSHTVLVALAALRSISMPLARVFTPARVPFLSVSGMTSRSRGKRLAAGAAFGAASLYLTARLLEAEVSDADPTESVRNGSLIVLWIAALAIVGFAAVPAWRAVRTDAPLRLIGQGAWAVALVVLGGGLVAYHTVREIGFWDTLTAAPEPAPPGSMLLLVLAALGPGAAAARRLPMIPRVEVLGRAIDRLDTGGVVSALLVLAASGAIGWWSVTRLVAGWDEGGWHRYGPALAAIAAAGALWYALFGRWRGLASPLAPDSP
jgi:predicted acylesterase/phospholipase RssA